MVNISVTGLTAERMLEIEASSVIDGDVVGDELILKTKGGDNINAGNVRGTTGPEGPAGNTQTVISTVEQALLDYGIAGVTVDDLPSTGIVAAHRTGAGSGTSTATLPEGTIEAAWACLAMGINIIDIDYRQTADGKLVVMHDDTVDRTTLGSGLISKHYAVNLPPIDPGESVGSGWGSLLHVPTVDEFLSIFGGKVALTIEAKGGIADVVPLANLIKRRGLINSVFINTNDVAVVSAIVAQGVLAHLWAWDDVTKITPGINAGASLLEVPFNVSNTVVTQCAAAVSDSTKKLRWFIAGPISTRNEYLTITPGIMGHVTDSIGHTNRSTGNNPLNTTIKPSLMAGKRGIGWRLTSNANSDQRNILNLQPGKGLAWKNVGGTRGGIYLGDMSGTMPGIYTLTMKFIPDSTFNASTPNIRFRFAATVPDGTGGDEDTDGYIVILNGNARFRLYSANTVIGGAATLLFDDQTADTFTPGSEYSISATITPTTVKVTVSGPGISKASSSIANTNWRGGHMYIWRITDVRPNTFITDFTRT